MSCCLPCEGLPPTPAAGIVPLLGKPGCCWECGLCPSLTIMSVVSSHMSGPEAWGPWGCGERGGVLPTWDIHVVKGFWAGGVPTQRPELSLTPWPRGAVCRLISHWQGTLCGQQLPSQGPGADYTLGSYVRGGGSSSVGASGTGHRWMGLHPAAGALRPLLPRSWLGTRMWITRTGGLNPSRYLQVSGAIAHLLFSAACCYK